jgi:Holliday junction resolvase
MVSITSPETAQLALLLSKYEPRSTIARTSGLLTAPQLQANTVRLEVLVHLAVAYCAGNKKPGYEELEEWLNQHLGQIELAEDPVEDVFITNVETPYGNRRIFEGIWESNDYFLQVVLDTLMNPEAPDECQNLLQHALALLRLSDCIAERLDLQRWHIEPSTPKGFVPVASTTRVNTRARAVTFTNKNLEILGVTRESIAPFILREEDRKNLLGESTGHSSLERRPIVDFGDALVLTLPSAVSPAIRRFVLNKLRHMRFLKAFGEALAAKQALQVEKDGLWELKRDVSSLSPPPPDIELLPSLHSWLLRYDINQYIHIILLHDRLDWTDEQGLSSFMEYPESLRSGLEKYLNKVAKHCQALPDYAGGMTLIVVGGLGRGFMLGFKDWPGGWRFSAIRVSDLLMLAGDIEQPIKRYLKCIKQKEWAEGQGVYFQNLNGDFNFYCYWRRLNFQLVPRMLPVGGSAISIGNDFVLPVRQDMRRLVDRHVVPTASGTFYRVMRFGRDAYFKSMQDRPIYASLSHLDSGVLAGIVKTSRGPSWLFIEPREGDGIVRDLLYMMWDGFIGLFDRLVAEIEALMPQLSTGPIEIRLNFNEVIVHEDYVPAEAIGPIVEPEVLVHFDQRMAVIKFPSNFMVHFQQPENTGEKLVLRALARGLIWLHQGNRGNIGETLTETMLGKVIGGAGMRVLHLFHTYYPIEHLLARKEFKTVFLSHEDFVFSKLRLSEGCTKVKPEATLTKKSECNDFLKKVVVKVWGQLRELLCQFDRTSVIRQALAVHEAVIRDREHWRRTAQAVIALYATAENVHAVAQKRELDRSRVALPARILLEMAVCECPDSGGRQLSQWERDDLLAKTALLLEAATDSDAVYAGLLEPTIQLHANGEYTLDRAFYEAVIRPFVANYFHEEFEEAAASYNKFYQRERPVKRTRADEIYSAEFINSFNAEFGLTLDEAIDGFAELMDLAVERDSVIVESTLGKLHERLVSIRGISPKACQAFLKTFGLFHRPAWDRPPQGFNEKDICPWRYGRRLSTVVRPLLIFGENEYDKVLYGAGMLRQGFGYLIERTERGQLPETFFTSKAMRSYWGAVNDERGHAFARSVADMLRKEGWEARNEVQMTELGAQSEFGDLDVLAWKPTGKVLLIECKRLQLARTVAEIAEICRRFKGEAKDDLDKHMRRVSWVMEHPSSLERIVGFSPDPEFIDARLVTNTHVPMRYLTSLPIPSEKIGPLR